MPALRRLRVALCVGLLAAGPVSAAPFGAELATAAAQQIGVTTGYDAGYRHLDYPGGDVATETGVCSDVVIRAYRALGIDLQVRVHEDMRAAFAAYPALWGLHAPDRNIDHRRVPNLQTFFRRHGRVLATDAGADWQPGDVVTWRLPSGVPHVGIVSSMRVDGHPTVIHNIGAGVRDEDVLFAYTLTGHYRYPR